MPEKEQSLGLLPHEMHFTLLALAEHTDMRRRANLAVGEANEQSGGDWALDDPAVRDAAFAAHQVDLATAALRRQSELSIISYPNPDDTHITFGSRFVIEDDIGQDTYDLGTRAEIAGMPKPHDSTIVSPEAPMGRAVIGKEVGKIVTWEVSGGLTLTGTILSVDQCAVRDEYAVYLTHEQSETAK